MLARAVGAIVTRFLKGVVAGLATPWPVLVRVSTDGQTDAAKVTAKHKVRRE
jgi:hypothetical protein